MEKSKQHLCRPILKLVSKLSVSSLFLSGLAPLSAAALGNPLVIYGKDDRTEVYQEKDASRRALADSVVAFLPNNAVQVRDEKAFVNGAKYGEENLLCRTEKYWNQVAPAFCSGVLVGEDIIATAGHCVMAPGFCASSQIVFGFNIDSRDKDPSAIRPEDIYRCKEVLHQELNGHGADFALVKLDRRVVGRTPLRIAASSPGSADDLFVIGHPMGLPAKIAGGAKVRRPGHLFYVANLDSFSGNSGSPVFNAATNEVAGLLVRGEQDFQKRPGAACQTVMRCKDDLCRGEDVTNPEMIKAKLSEVSSALPQ